MEMEKAGVWPDCGCADGGGVVNGIAMPASGTCLDGTCAQGDAYGIWADAIDADATPVVPSARTVQPIWLHLVVILTTLGVAAWQLPQVLLVAACAVLWLQAGLRWAAVLMPAPICMGRLCMERRDGSPDPPPALAVWPLYTVLVPLHDEAASVGPLMRALSRLDYPVKQLEVLMVCEADDLPTLEAVRSRLRAPLRLVAVPPGEPRTKPKALRVAMREARGELVTIYDAEDAPHPAQLRTAARAFARDPRLVALQAPLDIDNRAPLWITRQFALEYASLFHVWVPFLARMGWPLPLGGTSNHIRRDALEAAGGWDAHNVTEDADLSFRLALEPGARIGWIAPPTREEAVADTRAWVGQRTRWMKGYSQTWVAHMHAPFRPGGKTGLKRFITLQLTVGLTVLTGLLHLPSVVVVGTAVAFGYVPSLPLAVAALTLYASGLAAIWLGARRAGLRVTATDIAGVPLYWMLMALPAWRGVAELWHRPFYWNKTAHGVSERDAADTPTQSNTDPIPSAIAVKVARRRR